MEVVNRLTQRTAKALVDTPSGVEEFLEIRQRRLGQASRDRQVIEEILALQRQSLHGLGIDCGVGNQADGVSQLRKGAEQVICMHMMSGDSRPGQRFLDEEQTHARVPTTQERNSPLRS